MPQAPTQLPAWIYRSTRKSELYLYLAAENGFEVVPAALLERFGRPEFVMRLDLHPGRTLARVDVATVLQQLAAHGYYLQLPPRLEPDLYQGA